ncbi:hypothetical protein BH10BAC2_BH10BAC2_33360 [soil metagenome]
MTKLYLTIITILFLFPIKSFSKPDRSDKVTESKKGYVTLKLDNSKNSNKPIEAAYIILDKYNRTGAGYVSKKFEVKDNQVLISDLPEGKYYIDIFTRGFYKQYFTKVIYISKKGSSYTFTLEEVRTFTPRKTVMPKESNDFAKTSVVHMK